MITAIKPKVLVLGGTGMVGQAVQRCAPQSAEIIAPSSRDVDLRDTAAARAYVHAMKPNAVINCAAYTRVDDAESDAGDATLLNAELPRMLATECNATGARLLHISTDYVFDGSGAPPYVTGSETAPLNVYGESKLSGERAVLKGANTAAVVRTAWVHAGHGTNFVGTAVRILQGGGTMRAVDDQISTPTRAQHLAVALWELIHAPDARGLLHFTDAGVASWYDVAMCVLETLQAAGCAAAGADVLPTDSSAFPRAAKRPRVSVLDKHDTWKVLKTPPSHWRLGVAASTLEYVRAHA